MRLGELLKLRWTDVSFAPVKDRDGVVPAPVTISKRRRQAR